MKNKKGTTPLWVTVLIVIMIVTVAILVFFMNTLSSANVTAKADKLCKFSNQAAGKGGAIHSILPEGTKPVRAICPTQVVKIYPDDWTNCDKSFRNQRFDNRVAALKNCATQQVADLVYRCWQMNGEGVLDTGSRVCFSALVSSGEDPFDTKEKILDFADDWANSEFADAGYCDAAEISGEFINTYYATHPSTLTAFEKCDYSKKEITESILERMSRFAVRGFYRDKAVGLIGLCLNVNDNDGDGILDQDDDDDDNDGILDDHDFTPFGSVSLGENVFNSVYTPMVPVTESEIKTALLAAPTYDEYLELQLDGDEEGVISETIYCSSIEVQLKELFDLVIEQDIEIDHLNKYIGTLQPGDTTFLAPFDPFEITKSLNDVEYSLPDIGEISVIDLLTIMQSVKNPASGYNNYCVGSSPCAESNPNFVEGYVITPDNNFEVTYCDSGIVSLDCESDAVKIGGTGGTLTTHSSVIPEYCKFFDFEIGVFGFDSGKYLDIKDTCEALTCNIFGC